MTTPDARAAAYYEDPSNLELTGRRFVRRKERGPLEKHVPIRFDSSTIDHVRELAEQDGVTVSNWIRNVVEREVEKRLLIGTQHETSRSFEFASQGFYYPGPETASESEDIEFKTSA